MASWLNLPVSDLPVLTFSPRLNARSWLRVASLSRPVLQPLWHVGVENELPDLILVRAVERPHDAETDELGVGQVPLALRQLRVLDLPVGGGRDARGAPQEVGIVRPRAAAHHARILVAVRQA